MPIPAPRLLEATALVVEASDVEALCGAAVETTSALGATRGALYLCGEGDAVLDDAVRAVGAAAPDEPTAVADAVRQRATVVTRSGGRVTVCAPFRLSSSSGATRPTGILAFGFDAATADASTELVELVARHVGAAMERLGEKEAVARARAVDDAFAAVLAHDLRNPLSGVLAAAQLAGMRAGANESLAKPLGRIVTSAKRMGRLVDQLVDFTHLRAGRPMEIERRPTDLVAIARQAADEVGGGLARVADGVASVTGEWDEARVTHALALLVGGSVRRAKEGVTVSVHDAGASGRVVIQDPSVLTSARLAEMREPTRDVDRDGLGAYVAGEIIAAHGGTLTVTSAPGEGTTFVVVLPRAASAS